MAQETPKSDPSLPCGIGEYYKNPPPLDARRTVEKLLLAIPPKYLEGLGGIILCDAPSFKEHYGSREAVSAARYVKTKNEAAPWIEICVDRLIPYRPRFLLRVSFLVDFVFSYALYHEIGHHIHWMQKSGREKSEAFAETWREKLQKHYLLRKYWFIIIPAFIICLPFKRQLDRMYESYECKSS